ncbi:hypothetical protein [Actinoallomurus vinaceus]
MVRKQVPAAPGLRSSAAKAQHLDFLDYDAPFTVSAPADVVDAEHPAAA